MKLYKRFAFISVVLTYFLIFLGGLVRVSGAGLGCPDWPKCFGRWIPPTSVEQLPPGFDPASFNFTLAWIEYINRLVGVLVGLSIAVTAILAIIHFRQVLKVWLPSVLAAILVAYQGWHGSRVVASELEPIVVSAHMVLAFLIISLLLYAAVNAHLILEPAARTQRSPRGLRTGIILVWAGSIIQVLLGTQVRGQLEHAVDRFPLLFGYELFNKIGIVDEIHMAIGGIVIVASFFIAWLLLSKVDKDAMLIRQSAWAIMLLAAVQLVIGNFLLVLGLPALMQLLHLWSASLLVGILLVLFTAMKPEEVQHG